MHKLHYSELVCNQVSDQVFSRFEKAGDQVCNFFSAVKYYRQQKVLTITCISQVYFQSQSSVFLNTS